MNKTMTTLPVMYRRTSPDWITATCAPMAISALGSTEEKAKENLRKAIQERIDDDPSVLDQVVEVKTSWLLVENGLVRWNR